MTRLSTTRCHTVGRPEISFGIDSAAASLAAWLVEYFEDETLGGRAFNAGQTVALGWSAFRLRPAGADLEVLEPDFSGLPIEWIPGVSQSIRHLFLQRSVCDLFGCPPAFASLQEAGFQVETFPESADISISRDEPEGSKSGWWFMPSTPVSNAVALQSLYQLAVSQPRVVPFLALPPGSAVRMMPGHIHVNCNGRTLTSDDSELLRGLL